jgi:hypothetical protein
MADNGKPCGCDESKNLREAIRQYYENNDDTGMRCYYEPSNKLAKATKALKDAMMRSHMGETVSYEEMAQAVLDAVKEG